MATPTSIEMFVMDILKSIIVAVLFLLFLAFANKILSSIKHVYSVFRDYYVLWNIAFGAHPTRRNLSQPMRLHPYVCNPQLLDNISMEELFTFGKSMVSTDITCETFRKVVVSYKLAILFRERLDGSLRGMCLLSKDQIEHNGKKLNTIKLGLALFHNYYQGGPYLYYVIIYHALKALMLSPRTPVYILTKLFSYKSYLALVNTCKEVYPVYNKEIPEMQRSLLNSFADSVRFPNETYNPDTFILEREMSHIRAHAANISYKDLQNPHIKFFATQNPGWQKGHCMFCITQVTWPILLKTIKRSIGRAIRGRRADTNKAQGNNSEQLRQHFDRHLSFHCDEARSHVSKEYTIKDGQAVLKESIGQDVYVASEQ